MMKYLYITLIIVICFCQPNRLYSRENSFNDFNIYSSNQKDRFVLNVPNKWNTKKENIENGTKYIFWDNKSNAFSIVVKSPNSFLSLLKKIENKEISKKQLIQIQKEFAEAAPLKIGLSLSINVISNRKALTQNYLIKQETLNVSYYLINISHDFLYNDKQYTISYSTGGITIDKAIQNFENSEQKYFNPMLISLFLN